MIQRERAMQGNADGLCGLYSLINFLVWKGEIPGGDGTKPRHEAFRYVLEAAERCGLLTASKMYTGFEWPDLVAIFNEYSTYNFYNFVAVPLSKVHSNLKNVTNESLFGCIVDDGGAAVAAIDNGGHWVLVNSRNSDGSFSTIDSSVDAPVDSRKKFWSLTDGVALLRTDGKLMSKAS